MTTNALFPLFMLVLLTACGKGPSSDRKIVTITPGQIAHLLENQSFECASLNGGKCPEGISRLFILDLKEPSQTELCTGFLTTTNRLVTNSHCVSTQEQCSNTYISIFNGTSYEVAKCKLIISAKEDQGPISLKKVDYAVLELDRHIRTSETFRISGKEPELGNQLTAWVIDHMSLFTGRITEISCVVKARNHSLELEGCPIISGNSGSPVVNERGHLVGVVWGSNTGEYINEDTPLDERRRLDNHAFVTEIKYFRSSLSLRTRNASLTKISHANK